MQNGKLRERSRAGIALVPAILIVSALAVFIVALVLNLATAAPTVVEGDGAHHRTLPGIGMVLQAAEHPPDTGNWSRLPATLVGSLGWPGAEDRYAFEARAGEELVFHTLAMGLGSELRAVLRVVNADGKELARAGDVSRRPDPVLIFKVPSDGRYVLSVSDLARAGSRKVVLEASGIEYCDGTGIALLARLRQRQHQAGGVMDIRGLRPEFQEHLDGWQPEELARFEPRPKPRVGAEKQQIVSATETLADGLFLLRGYADQ